MELHKRLVLEDVFLRMGMITANLKKEGNISLEREYDNIVCT